ncbi:Protein phosphatase 2C 6 [Vanrija albida]|uniref:Protein phosphatase 2C 6 n=1 Tax=Vanrija albida TaxID=181172 RepID=A0ABR3QET0_9TREE
MVMRTGPLSRAARSARASGSSTPARRLHDFVRGTTMDGSIYKVPLSSPKIVGVYSSRGQRAYQEDATSVHALEIAVAELQASLPSKAGKWDPAKAGGEALAKQVGFFGIFDGHGGRSVSSFLHSRLAEIIETCTPADIPAVVEETVELGGYFRRWRGGALQRYTKWAMSEPVAASEPMTLEERLTLAFLKADQMLRKEIEGGAEHTGSTASVVLLHSLDEPAQPHWAAKKIHLTVAQVGDTRVLLCNKKTGEAKALTDRHHAESRIEADRLRRMGTDRLISDSFGETRWMGAIENTRGFGDFEYKASGVTVEPEVRTSIIDGAENCYLIFVTDGLTSLLSDQELVDLARRSIDPTRAAKTIVHFGEDLAAQDNCTCIVVPLAGWGEVGGEDSTAARREYRRQQADMLSTRMQRM